jgi:cyclic-di-AMP phosphodiesterase PgpH
MFRRRPAPIVSRSVAFLFGLLIAVATLPLVVPVIPGGQALRAGDIAPTTIEARRDAQYESQVLTDARRESEAAKVTEVYFPADPGVRAEQTEKVRSFFEQVRAIKSRGSLSSQQQTVEIGTLPEAVGMTTAARSSLVAMDRIQLDLLAEATEKGVSEILARPVREANALAHINEYLSSAAPPSFSGGDVALRDMLTVFVAANSRVDTAATERLRQEVRANVSPELQTYSRGQVIIAEGQTITAESIEAMRMTGSLDTGFSRSNALAGVIFAFGFGGLLAIYIFHFQPFPSPPARRMLLTGFTIVAVLAAVRFIIPEVMPDREQHYLQFAIPVAAVAMIAASFADLQFAVVVAAGMAMFATFIGVTAPEVVGASFVGPLEALQLAMAHMAGGLVGAIAVYRAERLSRYAISAFAVAGATWSVLIIFWLLGDTRSNESLGWLTAAAAVNGLGAAVMTAGVFVILSIVFGVTTRLQLMELVQSDHPLLMRLQEEAPGTYHHSMMVAALAERAASRIGADSLVVRAGAYYHDIGKLAQPHYYIENMLDGKPSPHDSLPPTESAQKICDHVTNGMEIARRNRLPGIVRDFIPQHHGTRLVTYFYRRAVEHGEQVDPAEFRYAGPRPQSKESAIVMLADSCEAVVRARQDRADSNIDDLVDGILAERLAEGQLDECDITMRELQQVSESFKATLRAIYHPRIEYPNPTAEEMAIIASLADGSASAPRAESA